MTGQPNKLCKETALARERKPTWRRLSYMTYITSRGFDLPTSVESFRNAYYFNMWQKRLWPYKELIPGDELLWYETPSGRLVWRSRVVDVERFPYSSKNDARDRLVSRFGALDEQQPYFRDAPDRGYCLAYKVDPLERLAIHKPEGLRFPMSGWLRDAPTIAAWLARHG